MDVLTLCKEEEREGSDRPWYAVDPAKMYPAMIKRIKAAIKEDKLPVELVDDLESVTPGIDPTAAAVRYLNMAKSVSSAAWDDALKARSELPKSRSDAKVIERAKALECARLWFTRALKKKVGMVGIHILGNKDFKLDAEGY